MKKLIFILVGIAVFTNCDRDYTFDAAPGIIEIYVEDASGNNLLDPAFEGNILENAITATFWGKHTN